MLWSLRHIAYFHNVYSIIFFHNFRNMSLPFKAFQVWNSIIFAHDTNIYFSSQCIQRAIIISPPNNKSLQSTISRITSTFRFLNPYDLIYLHIFVIYFTFSQYQSFTTYQLTTKKTTRIINQYQGHMIL